MTSSMIRCKKIRDYLFEVKKKDFVNTFVEGMHFCGHSGFTGGIVKSTLAKGKVYNED